uniref:zinc finger protein BALDIBIS-like n=1 Tax=Erigeron canadensis TaxID=72917 RepID=UPI001CB91F4B|nr:zinc finger protein BALDIBIS-like [Erigeron canadensis]
MMSCDGFSSPQPSSLTPFTHETIISNPNPNNNKNNNNNNNSTKRKRNLPGNPDPDAEVIALSPTSLMATNRFVCEICSKGFQRDQNLQLHRRGHNLPWKLKQRNKNEVVRKKVYICPETTCVHHDPSRALGDLTGVKKHFSRKHGEKRWKCDKCLKKYAVQSDWKAHSKICGTREYKCDCGTLFSRKDSFITHRAFCDAISEENSRMASYPVFQNTSSLNFHNELMMMNGTGINRITNPQFPVMFGGVSGLERGPDGNGLKPRLPTWLHNHDYNINNNIPLTNSTNSSSFLGSTSLNNNNNGGILSSEMMQWLSRNQGAIGNYTEMPLKEEQDNNDQEEMDLSPMYNDYGGCPNAQPPPTLLSATALLQKASQIGSTTSTCSSGFQLMNKSHEMSGFGSSSLSQCENLSGDQMMHGADGLMMMMMAELKQKTSSGIDSGDGSLTRDFLGVKLGNDQPRTFSLQQELNSFTCSMNDSSIGFTGSQ